MKTKLVKKNLDRGAFTMAELSIFGAIALVLFITVMGLVRTVWTQDGWTMARLDSVLSVTVALESIRRDVWVSQTVRATRNGAGLALEVHDPKNAARLVEVDYQWSGASAPVVRSGSRLRTARLTGFTVTEREGALTLSLKSGASTTRPGCPDSRATELVVPVYSQESSLRSRYPEWVPDRSDPAAR
ncbi:MAG: hypothetical protein HY815_17565 [Candidatus Riflebacteria bacterium]|nr:hypothetical protein [Candidatus Riflebacteria bacterium]